MHFPWVFYWAFFLNISEIHGSRLVLLITKLILASSREYSPKDKILILALDYWSSDFVITSKAARAWADCLTSVPLFIALKTVLMLTTSWNGSVVVIN